MTHTCTHGRFSSSSFFLVFFLSCSFFFSFFLFGRRKTISSFWYEKQLLSSFWYEKNNFLRGGMPNGYHITSTCFLCHAAQLLYRLLSLGTPVSLPPLHTNTRRQSLLVSPHVAVCDWGWEARVRGGGGGGRRPTQRMVGAGKCCVFRSVIKSMR